MGILDTLKNIIGAKPKPSPAQTNAETLLSNDSPESMAENRASNNINDELDKIEDRKEKTIARSDELLAEARAILKKQKEISANQDRQLKEANEVLRVAKPSMADREIAIRRQLEQETETLRERGNKETEEDIPVPGDELKQGEHKKHKSDRSTMSQVIR